MAHELSELQYDLVSRVWTEAELPTTKWGAAPIGRAAVAGLLTGSPTARFCYSSRSTFIGDVQASEYYDAANGGVVLLASLGTKAGQSAYFSEEELAVDWEDRTYVQDLPPGFFGQSKLIQEWAGKLHPGKAPELDPHDPAVFLGYMVLASTLTHRDASPHGALVRLPGRAAYATAYKHVNGGEEPIIMPSADQGDSVQGREFLDMVRAGLWPQSLRFFLNQATNLVVGGSPLAEHAQAIATEHINSQDPKVVDRVVRTLRAFVSYQLPWAEARVRGYNDSGDLDRLTSQPNDEFCNGRVPDRIMQLFNQDVAGRLGIVLPAV